MKAWVVYLGTLMFGAIMIAGGIADRDPDDWIVRWPMIFIGISFFGLAVLGLFGGTANTQIDIPEADKGIELKLGYALIAAGSIATAYTLFIYFVSATPEPAPEIMAPWIKWVYIGGSVFVVLAGIALTFDAIAGRRK